VLYNALQWFEGIVVFMLALSTAEYSNVDVLEARVTDSAIGLIQVSDQSSDISCNVTQNFCICFVRYATASTTLVSAMSYLISRNTYRFLKPRK
jgi:hypothetical protein